MTVASIEVEAAIVLEFGRMRMPLKSHARAIPLGTSQAIVWRSHARAKLVKVMVSATGDVMATSLKVDDLELLTKPRRASLIQLDKFSTPTRVGATIRLELERRGSDEPCSSST